MKRSGQVVNRFKVLDPSGCSLVWLVVLVLVLVTMVEGGIWIRTATTPYYLS
jgi:hypothetical protein